MVVGIVASLLTGPNNPKSVNPKYFSPIITSSAIPKSCRHFLRFGVCEEKDFQVENDKEKDDGSEMKSLVDI